jgi:Zn-finger protein
MTWMSKIQMWGVYIKPVLQLMSVEKQRLTKFRGRDCTYSGCFLKNTQTVASVIYCPILIIKKNNTMVIKTLQNVLIFYFFQH